jgi:hypothetical protein
MPCSLDDLGHSLVLQRRRGRVLLNLRAAVMRGRVTPLGMSQGCGRRATMLRPRRRLVEQDEVLLRGLHGRELMRGWCRQARRTGGKP